MAVYKIFPIKDASLYEQYPVTNTGMDAILEASNYKYLGVTYYSRFLIEFSNTEITNFINNTVGTSSFSSNLKIYSAINTGLTDDWKLEFYPVSGSWTMGLGKYQDITKNTQGVSWEYRTYSGSTKWENEGGDYYSSPVHTQSFEPYSELDIDVPVTDTVLEWYSGSKPNDGFLVKMSSSIENNENFSTINRFFSIDTNTIYPPSLEIKWDDYSFNTGSSTNSLLSGLDSFVSIYNNKPTYYSNDVAKMRVAAMPKYPDRTFQTSSFYSKNYYLPDGNSFYAIKDVDTNIYVVDFDNDYTKISADSESSYFNIYMSGLEPERYYTVIIKTIIDGITQIWEDSSIFKVSN